MNNSTLTLQTLKDWLVRETDDNNITDTDMIDAINDFYTMVHMIERRVDPQKYRAVSGTIALDSNGYDLTQLTNPANWIDGFKVYKDTREITNVLLRRFPSTSKQGYYIEGDTLYSSNISLPQNIVIEYRTKGARVALGTDLSTHTLQINQDLEKAVRKYVRMSFFNGEYQFDLRDDAENMAMQEIQRYFDGNANAFSY